MKKKPVSGQVDIDKLLALANLLASPSKKKYLTTQVSAVLTYVSQIQSLNLEGVEETSQVTGQENVFREDQIQPERIFTQEEALLNAAHTYQGFFVVPAIFE